MFCTNFPTEGASDGGPMEGGNNAVINLSCIENTSVEIFYTESSLKQVLDAMTRDVLLIVLYCVFIAFTCIAGIVTNIINIIVFLKQGFGDSINISLLGLAVSDLGSLITMVWVVICFSPFMQYADVPFMPDDVAYLTGGWPRIFFSRVTGWITAFITFERCLCITMPLKVKMIITPNRTRIIIAMIFVLQAGLIMPQYFTGWLVWKFSPERNRTVLGLTFSEDRQEIDTFVFIVSSMILPVLAFVIVIICTVILSVKLKTVAMWREQSVNKDAMVSNKDKNIIRMVSLISTIFIICFTPNVLVFFGMSYEPEFNMGGAYVNLLKVVGAIMFLFESFNSSINIICYLKMSSKFRATFNKLFQICTKRNNS